MSFTSISINVREELNIKRECSIINDDSSIDVRDVSIDISEELNIRRECSIDVKGF